MSTQGVQMSLQQARKWFAVLCGFHLLIWTFGPALVRNNLPFDTVESIAWGNQWQWGYNKHPPFAPWLCALFSKMGTGWPVYLLAQLAVIVAFWAVWRLANRFLTPLQALVSVMLLEGVIYYNLISPKINPTTMMTPVWALIMLLGYVAIVDRRWYLWLGLGIMAAISILTKYEAPFLLLPLALLCLCTPEGLKNFKHIGPYVGLVAFVVVLIPHFLWSKQHNFIEIQYLFQSGAGERHAGGSIHGAVAHVYYPFMMVVSQLGAVAGLLVMTVLLWRAPKHAALTLSRFQWRYCLMMGLGPLVVLLLYAAITGSYLYAKWCTPFFSLLGILVVAGCRPVLTKRVFKQVLVVFFVVALGLPAARLGYLALGPSITGKARPDAYFPGPQSAQVLTRFWHQLYQRPLSYVAGSHYLVANVSVYSPDHPIPYMDWSNIQSPWVNVKTLNQKGALFVWWVRTPLDRQVPAKIMKRFPATHYMGVFKFAKVTRAKVAPILMGVAVLPPAGLRHAPQKPSWVDEFMQKVVHLGQLF